MAKLESSGNNARVGRVFLFVGTYWQQCGTQLRRVAYWALIAESILELSPVSSVVLPRWMVGRLVGSAVVWATMVEGSLVARFLDTLVESHLSPSLVTRGCLPSSRVWFWTGALFGSCTPDPGMLQDPVFHCIKWTFLCLSGRLSLNSLRNSAKESLTVRIDLLIVSCINGVICLCLRPIVPCQRSFLVQSNRPHPFSGRECVR